MNIDHHGSCSTIEELTSLFKTDIHRGLDWPESDRRLGEYGLNEFKTEESPHLASKYLEQFKNPLIQLLLASVIISVFMGQFDDAISITLAIIIVVTVAFVQEYRSEQSLQELNKLVPPSCKTIRNGRHEEFLAKYLVPGDIVLIATGDRVPADIKLVEANSLSIDESSLTGETEAAVKRPLLASSTSPSSHSFIDRNIDINSNHTNIKPSVSHSSKPTSKSCPNQEDTAYMGTLVQSGNGKGIVIGTGESTQFGSVFKMMQSEEAPKSPLQVNMDELGKHLSLYSLGIIIVIVLIGWIQSRPVVEMFTIGVSLAVAAIPEGLPIVVTVTLALGVMRMARKKAVVKHLPAVETLGCVHVICTDKTGTLTKNEMTATHILTSESYEAEVTGSGYETMGDIILQDLSLNQTIQMQSIRRMVLAGCLCNNARFDSSGNLIGQATEGAIIILGKKLEIGEIVSDYERIEEIPFSSVNKFMAVRCRSRTDLTNDGSLFKGTNYFVKGAVEILLKRCTHMYSKDTQVVMDESHKQDILRRSEMIESRGLRVLAKAYGDNLENLTYLGFLGIYDPPRPGVKDSIAILHESSIQVKMVTGDSKTTATSIARMLGIMGPSGQAMSGEEIDQLMSSSNLRHNEKAEKLENVSVFYRVAPQHKVTIVKMLQNLDYVVAMTGDGVNDGVALKRADIGISMGSGTDVCKEASDVILVDDDLSTIVAALEEGKGIYHNIRNFIKFQLSTSIAALSLIAMSTIFHVPNPLNAMQILYINILMDGPPAQSLGVEQVDMDVLKQPPRNIKEPVITKDLLIHVFISAAFIVVGTMIVFISEVSFNRCLI